MAKRKRQNKPSIKEEKTMQWLKEKDKTNKP